MKKHAMLGDASAAESIPVSAEELAVIEYLINERGVVRYVGREGDSDRHIFELGSGKIVFSGHIAWETLASTPTVVRIALTEYEIMGALGRV